MEKSKISNQCRVLIFTEETKICLKILNHSVTNLSYLSKTPTKTFLLNLYTYTYSLF